MAPTWSNTTQSLPVIASVVLLLLFWGPWWLCLLDGTSADALAAPGFVPSRQHQRQDGSCRRKTRRRLSTTSTPDSGPFHTIQDALDFVDDILSNESTVSETEEDMIQRVDALHAADVKVAEQSPLICSRDINTNEYPASPSFERIHIGDTTSRTVVVRSNDPILSPTDVATIRSAADAVWARSSEDTTATSRFTHQYPGNSEAHVSDLSVEAIAVVNRALEQSIYPLVDAAFSATDLCVYDALVIRYNATGGTTSGAGQPLHRDLGAVSVNLQLSVASAFTGGGTLFEEQLGGDDDDDTTIEPLHPKNVGYGLAHRSTDRHAGAATIQGVRDILVLFLLPISSTPSLRAARWMQCRSYCGCNEDAVLCRIQHQRLAVREIMDQQPYGQAHHYLGSALRDFALQQEPGRKTTLLQGAFACFRYATQLSPYDARIYNDWGIAAREIVEGASDEDDNAERLFRHAYDVLRRTEAAGCNVEQDMDRIALNLGLCLADQDQFAAASAVLERTACKQDNSDKSRTVQDAARLWSFCQQQSRRAEENRY